jgi:hypothetical protein
MSFVVCTKCFCCNDAEFRSREMYVRLPSCKAFFILDITINNENQVYWRILGAVF